MQISEKLEICNQTLEIIGTDNITLIHQAQFLGEYYSADGFQSDKLNEATLQTVEPLLAALGDRRLDRGEYQVLRGQFHPGILAYIAEHDWQKCARTHLLASSIEDENDWQDRMDLLEDLWRVEEPQAQFNGDLDLFIAVYSQARERLDVISAALYAAQETQDDGKRQEVLAIPTFQRKRDSALAWLMSLEQMGRAYLRFEGEDSFRRVFTGNSTEEEIKAALLLLRETGWNNDLITGDLIEIIDVRFKGQDLAALALDILKKHDKPTNWQELRVQEEKKPSLDSIADSTF